MQEWTPPLRPAAYAEQALITAVINGEYPPGSLLPAERELASRLGVTRPTLRETLQRLARDGWLAIQQGKPTRVKNYWVDGGLNVLNALVHYSEKLSPDFIPNLLHVRLVLAPAYARLAVEHSPSTVFEYLQGSKNLDDRPQDYASFDWHLHYTLTVASGNPIFTLILNGFAGFYEQMACLYFENPIAREASKDFYIALAEATQRSDLMAVEQITREVMLASIELWNAYVGGHQ